MSEPIVASRSERAILAEIEDALNEAAGIPRKRRPRAGAGETHLAGTSSASRPGVPRDTSA